MSKNPRKDCLVFLLSPFSNGRLSLTAIVSSSFKAAKLGMAAKK